MGSTISVVAVFDVSSVRNVIVRQMTRISTSGGTVDNPLNPSPMNRASPVAWKPWARAKPPPNRSTMFHGSRRTTSDPMIVADFAPGDLVGTRKRMQAIVIATVPSSSSSPYGRSADQPGTVSGPISIGARNTHSTAVVAKTARITRSSNPTGPSFRISDSTTSRSTETSSGTRKKTRVISIHAKPSMSAAMGSAMTNHTPNEMCGASGNVIAKILWRERFGGVPTSVAIPPAEQA